MNKQERMARLENLFKRVQMGEHEAHELLNSTEKAHKESQLIKHTTEGDFTECYRGFCVGIHA